MKAPAICIRVIILVLLPAFLCLSPQASQGQILKKIGNKIEKSVERRIDRKIDKGVEKGLDKVEDGVDESVKEATKERPKEEKEAKAKDANITTLDQVMQQSNSYSEADAKKARENDGMILVSANCNDFSWFKKGAMMEFEVKDNSDKNTYTSKIEVKNVRHEGNKAIADVTGSDNKGNVIDMNYVCNGNELYFDLTDMIKSTMEKQGQSASNMDISFDGGLVSIPKNLYPGQQLEDAVFTMNMSSQGMNIGVTSFLKERTVHGTETVTTPAGTFKCIKITGLRTMQMNMMGSKRKMGKPVIEEMYFAPSIGMVKTISKTEKGKVESKQQLVSYSF